jgi:hypothetical protein
VASRSLTQASTSSKASPSATTFTPSTSEQKQVLPSARVTLPLALRQSSPTPTGATPRRVDPRFAVSACGE